MSVLAASLMLMGTSADAALAANTGGASASEPPTRPATSTAPKVHLFPVTARSSNIAYKGPVYVKTTGGQVIPWSPTTSTTTGTVASATGGSPPSSPTTPATQPLELPPTGISSATGPTDRPELLVPGNTARYVDGLAAAPMSAPAVVQEIVWAGNELIGLPYIYGGGHGSFTSRGYDCSGTVSFALHGASLLSVPKDSSEFETWGSHGAGRWVAIFSNPGHAYMTVAGLRLDTSSADDPSNQQGPRWRPLRRANSGYVVRHPLGL